MSTNRYDLDVNAHGPLDRRATRLLYVTVTRYSEEWNSVLHTHPCAEVFFVTGGSGFLRLADRQVALHLHDAIIVNANVLHTELSGPQDPLEYTVLGVDGMDVREGGGDAGFSVLPAGGDAPTLRFLFDRLRCEIEDKRPHYDTVCQDLLEVILIQLMRRGAYEVRFVPPARRVSRECAIVHRYIDDHFKEKLTLDDLAAVAHVSKFYLSHNFAREYGVSPISYLLDCRIRESLYLLAETHLSLAEIAGMLGFSSPSYFSQSFKRSEGLSPLAYRAQSRDRRNA